MKDKILLNATIELSEGVVAGVNKIVGMTDEQMAEMLRSRVQLDCQEVDDPGVDWYYCEQEGIVFLGGERKWVASRQKKHVMMMKLADMLDGGNYSAEGNDCGVDQSSIEEV